MDWDSITQTGARASGVEESTPRMAVCCKSRVLPQHTQPVAQILNQVLNPVYFARIAAFLFGLLDSVQVETSAPPRFLGCHPLATYSWVFRSRWSRSSSSNCCSACARRNNDRNRSGIVYSQCSGRILQPPLGANRRSRLFELNNPRNGARKPAPVICFFFELSPPQSCQRIIFRPPSILGRFPLGCNPAFLFQLVQGLVERSVAHV